MTQVHTPRLSSYRTGKNMFQASLTEKVIRSIVGLYEEGYRSATHSLLKQLVLDYSKAYRNDNIDDRVKTVDGYLYQLSSRAKASGQLKEYVDLLRVEANGALTINDVAVARWLLSQADDE
jgi:hypothetical protein